MDRSRLPTGGLTSGRAAQAVLANVHDAVILVDRRRRIRGANDRFWSWTNLDPSRVLGVGAHELWEDPSQWTDWMTGLRLEGGLRASEVFELKTRDGDLIPVEVQFAALPGRWGTQSAVLVLHDQRPLRLLEKLVREDALTGVPSRATILPRLEAELERTQKYATPLGVVLLDIDGFQTLNDRWGPDFGDEVLRVIGADLREAARPTDSVGRVGGEEFLFVLPQTNLETAVATAERLRSGLERRLFRPQGTDVRVTASFGVTVVHPRGHDTLTTVLARAAETLAGAKQKGRNRVEVSP